MRHKLPYEHDTEMKGADLNDGVACKQTFGSCDDDFHYREKERLERSVSKSGKLEDERILQENAPYYFHAD